MPVASLPNRSLLVTALLMAALTGLSTAPRAAEHGEHAAPAASKPAAREEAPAASAEEASAKPARKPPAKLDPIDPIDAVRERLAAKLGATRAPDTANPNVVRVTTKATESAAPGQEAKAVIATTGDIVTHGLVRNPAPRRATVAMATPMPTLEAPRAATGHWDYAGPGGPESWGQMKPEFATCSTGKRQSPIDIRDGIKVNLDPVQFDYKPTGFSVLDNGHTVQVNVGPGNSIEVMGRRYELIQFHFHRPSEERINGKQFDMVVHLVHKDLDGRLAVVAVLLDRGSAQPIVQTVWNNLPLEKGEEVAARVPIDLNALLPTDRAYFTYMGSLTTPPCSEGVLWMVMRTPLPISPEQIGIFSRLYPMNARPIQSASGRLIKESN